MKYLICCMLLLNSLYVKAQKKIAFDLEFDAGAVFSRSKPIEKKLSPGMIFGTKNSYKNLPAPQFALGVRANYKLNQELAVHAGVSLSYIEAKRRNTVTIPNTFPNGPENFEFVTEEYFKFLNIDIPLAVTYSYKKWALDVGIIPSIIVDSKFKETKDAFDPAEITLLYPWENNSSIPPPSTANKAKNYLSLFVSPLYQMNSKLKLGIEYTHGLTKAYFTDAYASDYYQSMKLSTLGLKLLYKIK